LEHAEAAQRLRLHSPRAGLCRGGGGGLIAADGFRDPAGALLLSRRVQLVGAAQSARIRRATLDCHQASA
jgi:hypothetical protein